MAYSLATDTGMTEILQFDHLNSQPFNVSYEDARPRRAPL